MLAQLGRIIPKYFGDGAEIPVFLTGNFPHRFTQNMAIKDASLLRGRHVGAISTLFDGGCWILPHITGNNAPWWNRGNWLDYFGSGSDWENFGIASPRNFTTTPETLRPVLISITAVMMLRSSV